MKKKTICITIEEEIWTKAKEMAKADNRTLSNFLSNLVVEKENYTNKGRGLNG